MRILVIEDEPKVSNIVRRGLVAERFAVDIASDGSEGLELARAFPYDLIILDFLLPTMSGYDVLQRIRRNNASVPVVVLTAKGAVEDKVRMFECGADDYLTKPFAFAELLVRSKALLRRGMVNRSSSIMVADLELNRMTQQVKRANKCIDLTAKEFAILEYLMQNAGRVLSRQMIIGHVWDHSFDGVMSIVDGYIGHIRAKVDDGQARKLIRTVRGSGYSIRIDSDTALPAETER